MYIEAKGFTEAYVKLCEGILAAGVESAPRNMLTSEVLGVIVKVKNPRTRLIDIPCRKLSIPFAIGEWLWCMQGKNELNMLKYYAPSYGKYSDDGATLHGAYGVRILPQLSRIIEVLNRDGNSRRAVLPIYGVQDVGIESKDIPCTLSFQVFIRDNKLNMVVYMRSNDIFLGFPYDIFNFSMYQEYLATLLGIEIGEYVHMVGSCHYYHKNQDVLAEIACSDYRERFMDKMPKNELGEQLSHLFSVEEKLRNNVSYECRLNEYFKWFEKILKEYQERKYK